MHLGKLQEMVRDRKPGVLQSVGLQRVRHNWATEQNYIPLPYNNELIFNSKEYLIITT